MICLLHCDPPAVFQSVSQIWWAAKKVEINQSRNTKIDTKVMKKVKRKFKFPSTLNEDV